VGTQAEGHTAAAAVTTVSVPVYQVGGRTLHWGYGSGDIALYCQGAGALQEEGGPGALWRTHQIRKGTATTLCIQHTMRTDTH
jgi:hypothetical protein